MKNILVIFVVGTVLFAASAGLSMFLQNKGQPPPELTGEEHEKNGKGSEKAYLSDSAPPSPMRTLPNANPDNIVLLADKVRAQQESVRQREQHLTTRQKHVELIYQDLKSERKTLDDLRGQINTEMKALSDKMDSLEKKAGDLQRQKEQNAEKIGIIDKIEQTNYKKMSTWYDKLDPTTAGEMLQHMADTGKLDMAVRILSSMKDSQAANVLAQIPDRTVAVQLLEKMRGLQRPGSNEPGN